MEILIKLLIFCKILILNLKFTYETMILILIENYSIIIIFQSINQQKITKIFI